MSMPLDDEGGGVVDADHAGVFPCGCALAAVGAGFSLRWCQTHRAANRLAEENALLRASLSEPGDEVDAWLRERRALTEENAALKAALVKIRDECEPSEWGDVLRVCNDALLTKGDRCPS